MNHGKKYQQHLFEKNTMLQFITSDMTFPHSICHIVHLKRIIIVKKVTVLLFQDSRRSFVHRTPRKSMQQKE